MKREIFVFLFLLTALYAGLFAEWSLVWTGEPGYETDGVEPNEGIIGGTYTFRIKFVSENPALNPKWVKLLIDLDEDGKFGTDEEFVLDPDPQQNNIWFIDKKISISGGRTQRQHIAYYFQAHTGDAVKSSQLTYGPIVGGFNNSFVIEGKGWFIEEALLPMEFVNMHEADRIVITNTSNSKLQVVLSLPEDFPGPFHPVEDVKSIETNAFVVSAVVTDLGQNSVHESDFNQNDSEDVVTFSRKRALGEVFGIGKKSKGMAILPGESVAIWLQLRAPAQTKGIDPYESQMVYIRLEVEPVN